MQSSTSQPSTSRSTGLCSTCDNRPECGHRSARGFDAMQCEEFDLGAVIAPAAVVDSTVLVASPLVSDLGADCAVRDGCGLALAAGPVHYCEEYR